MDVSPGVAVESSPVSASSGVDRGSSMPAAPSSGQPSVPNFRAPLPSNSAQPSPQGQVSPPQPGQSGPASSSLPVEIRETFAEMGVNPDVFPDTRTAMTWLRTEMSNVAEAMQRQQAELQYARQWASQSQQYQPQYRPQPGQQQAGYPQQQAEASPSWSPPEFDESTLQWLKVNPETGLYEPVSPHINPQVANQANQYADWLRRENRSFWKNPPQKVAEWIKPMMQEALQSVRESVMQEVFGQLQQQESQRSVYQSAQQVADAARDWAFVKGADGNFLLDSRGQGILSQVGQSYVSEVRALRAQGMTDPEMLNKYATMAIQGVIQGASTESRESRPESRRSQYGSNSNQSSALRVPSSGGRAPVVPGAAAAVPKNVSFKSLAAEEMRKKGIPISDAFVTST